MNKTKIKLKLDNGVRMEASIRYRRASNELWKKLGHRPTPQEIFNYLTKRNDK